LAITKSFIDWVEVMEGWFSVLSWVVVALVLVQCRYCLHFIFSKAKVENLNIFNKAYWVSCLGNDDSFALNRPT
jgi:hypothetical protein